MILGGGAAEAAEAVRKLAEKLDLPVLNTVNAKGVLASTHPLAVGGSPSLPCVRKAIAEADLILAVGTEFGETDFDMLFVGDLQLTGELIRIDIDAQQLMRNARPALALVADAGLCLRALVKLPERSFVRGGATRAKALRKQIRQEPHFHAEFDALFACIQSALPELILVGDSTLPTYYAVWQYETVAPRRYFHSATGGGTLGFAIPAALGAKLARPDNPVAALIGDGSSQFTLTELAAGVEAALPVAVLLWNNSGYQEIKQGMLAAGVVPIGVDIFTPDFLAIARGLGCEAVRVRNLDQLSKALQLSQQQQVPTVIELRQEDFITQPAGQWY